MLSRYGDTPCGPHVSNPPLYAHSNLFLGEMDEEAGDTASACFHYARVLALWGHAKPRSVTADEARSHARRLGCVL